METVANVEMKSLRERVAEVIATNDHDKTENEAKVTQRRRGDLKDQLAERLGVIVDESAITMRDHETPVVDVEGFRFSLGSPTDFDKDLCMLITCDACGKEYSRSVWSISSLADRFVPYPHANDYCLKQANQSTSLESLIANDRTETTASAARFYHRE